MEMNKQLLRTWLKTKRLAMDPKEVARLSVLIQQKLINDIKWQNLSIVSCYQAIESLNEVKTDLVIEHIQKNYPFIELALQAQKDDASRPKKYDLIIVPTLGYDSKGHRLGWGGGFYDRFLAGQDKALKVGLCYRNGLIKGNLPAEPHDIALDRVITEV